MRKTIFMWNFWWLSFHQHWLFVYTWSLLLHCLISYALSSLQRCSLCSWIKQIAVYNDRALLMPKHKSSHWLLSLILLQCHLYITQYMKSRSNSSPTPCAIHGQGNLLQSLSCLHRWQSSLGQNGAHMGPVGPRWASCWPHGPCYLGILFQELKKCIYIFSILECDRNLKSILVEYSGPSVIHGWTMVTDKLATQWARASATEISN